MLMFYINILLLPLLCIYKVLCIVPLFIGLEICNRLRLCGTEVVKCTLISQLVNVRKKFNFSLLWKMYALNYFFLLLIETIRQDIHFYLLA